MIKSLIASALLSASVGMPTITKKELNNFNYQGCYTTRMYYDSQTQEYSYYGDMYDFSDIGVIDYTFDTNSFISYYDYTHDVYTKCMSLRVTLDSSKTFTMYYNDAVFSNSFTVYSSNAYDDLSTNWQSFVIYFADVYNMPAKVGKLFDIYFCVEPNNTVISYTGWYNFSNTFVSTLPTWSLYGYITANNTLVNNIAVSYDGIECAFRSGTPNEFSFTLYDSPNWISNSRNIYLTNTLIPQSIYNRMILYGQFAYIPTGQINDFQDLFYSIADTPIKFIYNMFNFELLGMNFAFAIVSLLSLLVIVSVVKHVI